MRDDDTHTFDQFRDHISRVDAAVADWHEGRINLGDKRRRIAEENKTYYKTPVKSAASNEHITAMPRAYN